MSSPAEMKKLHPIYPLNISQNRRYLVDQAGSPFLLQGDAAWSLVVGPTLEEVELYLKNRASKNFNAVIVDLIEHFLSKSPPKNVYGVDPFTTPGDFSTPNEAYFAHADWVIKKAAENNILVLLVPM